MNRRQTPFIDPSPRTRPWDNCGRRHRSSADASAALQAFLQAYLDRRAELGTDFVVTEECNRYRECDVYVGAYGDDVLVIEYRRADFTTQVRGEHAAITEAIAAGDAVKARAAAGRHMANAIRRIENADPAFWTQEGARLAQPLVRKLRKA